MLVDYKRSTGAAFWLIGGRSKSRRDIDEGQGRSDRICAGGMDVLVVRIQVSISVQPSLSVLCHDGLRFNRYADDGDIPPDHASLNGTGRLDRLADQEVDVPFQGPDVHVRVQLIYELSRSRIGRNGRAL
ncbi:MAG: hypothetical protein ACE5JJ_09925 [Nitrospinota bacterium]